MFVCLIPFGTLGLEALSYFYWEKPSLNVLKEAGEGLIRVLICSLGKCNSSFAMHSGHVFGLAIQCWVSTLRVQPRWDPWKLLNLSEHQEHQHIAEGGAVAEAMV